MAMAVLVVARLTGNPDEIVEKIDRHLTPVMNEVGPRRGALWHSVAKTSDGVMVVDVWESADGVTAAMGEERLRSALAESGLPDPQIDFYDLVEHGPL